MRKGVFILCEKLYGLRFSELKDIPIYHPDVKVHEVKESDSRHVGILHMEFHPRDAVELPSQIMENWAIEPELLKLYTKHYKTGEAMPNDLIEKLDKSSLFNQGFMTVLYLAASILDMDWHTISAPTNDIDIDGFETDAMSSIGLMSEIIA